VPGAKNRTVNVRWQASKAVDPARPESRDRENFQKQAVEREDAHSHARQHRSLSADVRALIRRTVSGNDEIEKRPEKIANCDSLQYSRQAQRLPVIVRETIYR
jgi:hypothetical protein